LSGRNLPRTPRRSVPGCRRSRPASHPASRLSPSLPCSRSLWAPRRRLLARHWSYSCAFACPVPPSEHSEEQAMCQTVASEVGHERLGRDYRARTWYIADGRMARVADGRMGVSLGAVEAAASAQLRYVSDDRPGIRRLRRGNGFRYVDTEGRAV